MDPTSMRRRLPKRSMTTSAAIVATRLTSPTTIDCSRATAPRTSGIWDGVRREIADAIVAAGGTADEVDGPLGAELRCRMPQAGPDGRTVFAPARFLGFDGPRWFLRGVLSGPAAIDVDAAAALVGVFRDVVVHRGSGPMAPREAAVSLLPLQPRQIRPSAAASHSAACDTAPCR